MAKDLAGFVPKRGGGGLQTLEGCSCGEEAHGSRCLPTEAAAGSGVALVVVGA